MLVFCSVISPLIVWNLVTELVVFTFLLPLLIILDVLSYNFALVVITLHFGDFSLPSICTLIDFLTKDPIILSIIVDIFSFVFNLDAGE